ncbi:MAG: BTAD domain-containing putative transcriptional regulator [Acidimicrobiales bacterium]
MDGTGQGRAIAVHVLGPLAVAHDGRAVALTGARLPGLLVRLLVARGRPVSAWELRDDVWPGATSDSTLRVAVTRLRAVLGDDGAHPQVLRHIGDGYSIDRDRISLDADRFEALLVAARKASGDPARARDLYEQGLALWRGPAFGELHDASYARSEAERLSSLHESAVEEHLDGVIAVGGGPDVLAELEAAVAAHPLRERRTAALMVALYRAGRQADALAAYRQLEDTLREGLGLIPSDDLRQLEVRVVSQDPTLLGSVEAPRSEPLAQQATSSARAALALARHGAFDEAARLSATAVATARESGDRLVLNRCLVMQARAIAVDGRPEEAHAAIREAADVARQIADGTGLAEVAMARFGFGAAEDDSLLVDLAAPLDLLPADAPRRVELLCAAMHQVAVGGSLGSAERLVQEATLIAQRTGDQRAAAVASVGAAVLASIQGQPTETVIGLTDQALAVAEEAGDSAIVVAGLHAVVRELLAAGDIDGLEERLAHFDAAARASLMPFALMRTMLLRSCIALARGELVEAGRRIDDAAALGVRLGVTSASNTTNTQRMLFLLEVGLGDLAVRALADRAGFRSWQATLALLHAEAGRHDEARGWLDVFAANPAAGPQPDGVPIAMLAGEAAWLSGWDGDTTSLVDIMRSQQGRVSGVSHATITLGPVDRALGLVALADGRTDEAVDLLRSAVVAAGSAPLWADRSSVGLAHALAVRSAPGDQTEAAALLDATADAPWQAADGGSAWFRAQHARATDALTRARQRTSQPTS